MHLFDQEPEPDAQVGGEDVHETDCQDDFMLAVVNLEQNTGCINIWHQSNSK